MRAPEMIAEIFAPFSQANGSITRTHGGTGLRLTIALNLAQLMGGDISVKAQLDEGATFTFSFDLNLASCAKTSVWAPVKVASA